MNNISLNKETLELRRGIQYIVVDALYINDIKEEISNLSSENIVSEIRNKVFPYTDTPFAEYIPTESIFNLEQIKKVDYNQIKTIDKSVLSTDSGVLIFIAEKLFENFVLKFDYGDLVNSSTNLINIDYWNSITSDYILSDVAILVSPGIDVGVEFDGGGTYKII